VLDFKINLSLDGCLIIEIRKDAGTIAGILAKKLSMTHHITEVLGIGGAEEENVLDTVKKADVVIKGTYSIRVKRIENIPQLIRSQWRSASAVFSFNEEHAQT